MSKTLRCGCTPHEGAELHNIPGCPVIQAHAYRDENIRLNKRLAQVEHLLELAIAVSKGLGEIEINRDEEE